MMNDQMRLCLTCFKFEFKTYENSLLACVNCSKYLLNTQIPENSELPICNQCSSSQTMIQSMIEEQSNAASSRMNKTR